LQQLGWIEGDNVQIEYRSGMGDLDQLRKHAADLVALAPDVILAQGGPSVTELKRATKTIPIVFVTVVDPVGAGMVESLSQPSGNATGFSDFEYGQSAKWLEMLREIVPRATRVGVIRNPANFTGIGQFAAIQGAAMVLGVELRPIDIRIAEGIERAVDAFARASGDGLSVTTAGAAAHRDLIVTLAARHRLPTIYPFRYYVTLAAISCGLIFDLSVGRQLCRPHPQGREANTCRQARRNMSWSTKTAKAQYHRAAYAINARGRGDRATCTARIVCAISTNRSCTFCGNCPEQCPYGGRLADICSMRVLAFDPNCDMLIEMPQRSSLAVPEACYPSSKHGKGRKRRDFITMSSGGGRVALAARRAQSERVAGSAARRKDQSNLEASRWVEGCGRAARPGWIEGRNLSIEFRWAGTRQSYSGCE
jgi:hypothetical protein